MPMNFKPAFKYFKQFLDAGGKRENVINWHSHYLHGSNPYKLARDSKVGIIYNPPGH